MSTSVSILFIEHESSISSTIQNMLPALIMQIHSITSLNEINSAIASSKPDIIILDWPRPEWNKTLEEVLSGIPDIPLFVAASKKEIQELAAFNREHTHGLIKPLNPEILAGFIEHFEKVSTASNAELVAIDPGSQELLKMAAQVAKYNVPVMISGESGVGKELVAHFIHDHSDRKNHPLIAINCAAIPLTMLESMLFGYEKGAYTGAIKSTPGKFEQAQHGTLLLDEISEMPLELQAKLLRVLQEKEVERLGGLKTIALDVRIIATTNRNLEEEVAEGRFRMDLFYRLNVFPLYWTPLRTRPLDIIPLVEYRLQYHSHLLGLSLPTLTQAAKDALLHHPWPGNAREVDNVVQRMIIMNTNGVIDAKDIHFDNFRLPTTQKVEAPLMAQPTEVNVHEDSVNVTKQFSLEQQEYELILKTLSKTLGNRTLAAKLLKISPRTLRYKLAKMRELGIKVPEVRLDYAET